MRLDHVGIAVSSIAESLPFYKNKLGLALAHEENVPSQNVRVVFLEAGESSIELLEPTGEGAVAKFLRERGPGLHHVAFATENLRAEMARLAQAGAPPLEKEPRHGSRGHEVCFLHPKHAKGTLVELVGHD
ncbi:MAG: methylmalonyl-CoA epimerase [Elusimicrobia bacterium]|nr:methylmalonyl-CoA epimerase [Elusimicrobiota bacterium]